MYGLHEYFTTDNTLINRVQGRNNLMAVTANLLIFFILLLTYCNIVISTCLKLEIFKSRAGFCFCWRREGELVGAKAKKTAKMAGTGKKVMALGMDNNEPSFYALQWTLDHFFVPFGQDPPFKLLIIHAQPRLASVVGFTGPGITSVAFWIYEKQGKRLIWCWFLLLIS